LSCSSADGHFCGSWNFNSNDPQFEGWRIGTDSGNSPGSTVSNPALSYSNNRLAVSFSAGGTMDSQFLVLETTLCASGQNAVAVGKKIQFQLTLDPPISQAAVEVFPYLVYSNGESQSPDVDVNGVASPLILLNSINWVTPPIIASPMGASSAGTLQLQFIISGPFTSPDDFGETYTGKIYLDNVSLQ
jgi:hypothetical protein